MALAATLAAALPGIALPGAGKAAAQSRFLSYGSEAECIAGGTLAAPLCRSAFANARAEFAAKTPSFPSMAQCARTYGACAPWPPGSSSRTGFRPRWDEVDIVDTPNEKTVTPAAASGVRRLAFAPQPLTEFRSLDVRGPARPAGPPEFPPVARSGARTLVRGAEPSLGASPPPSPGSGFKLEDGVLTFPAPARFAPKNLPKVP